MGCQTEHKTVSVEVQSVGIQCSFAPTQFSFTEQTRHVQSKGMYIICKNDSFYLSLIDHFKGTVLYMVYLNQIQIYFTRSGTQATVSFTSVSTETTLVETWRHVSSTLGATPAKRPRIELLEEDEFEADLSEIPHMSLVTLLQSLLK